MLLMDSSPDFAQPKKILVDLKAMSLDTTTLTEIQREIKSEGKKKKNIQELWDNIKWYNTCIIGVAGEDGLEEIFEKMMAKNFSEIMKLTKPQT